jgi:hypothetical protein
MNAITKRRINIIKSFFRLLFQYYLNTLENINIVWSKGYALKCNHYGGIFNVIFPTEIELPKLYLKFKYRNLSGTVWLRVGSFDKRSRYSQLAFFSEYVIPKLNKPIVLLTSDGDTNLFEDVSEDIIKSIHDSKYVVRWYSQNLTKNKKFNKIFNLPIGLDLHYDRGIGVGSRLLDKFLRIEIHKQKIPKILVDCCVNKTSKQILKWQS